MLRFCRKCDRDTERQRSGVCRICAALRQKAYRASGREREYQQAYYAANREKKVAYARVYAEVNRAKLKAKQAYYATSPAGRCSAKRAQCKERGIPFGLNASHFDRSRLHGTPCPVLGIPMRNDVEQGHPQEMHMDRMRPEFGYVPGNIRWVSGRANRLKNNATLEEVRLILADLERIYADG